MDSEKERRDEQFSIDANDEPGFLRFFRLLPDKPATTIRFFDQGDYYTCHGTDAIFAAKELFHTEAVIKYMRSKPNQSQAGAASRLEYVTMSKMNFDAFLRDLLLVRQYRVEVYENEGSRANPSWKLGHSGSPGNLFEFEDILFGSSSQSCSSLVAAVKWASDQGQKIVGFAVLDPGARKIMVTEFPDNDTFSALEAMLVQVAPQECLLPAEGAAGDKNATIVGKRKAETATSVSQVVDRAGILVTELKRVDFSPKDVIQDLNRLLKFKKGTQEDSGVLPETKKEHAMSAVAAIIKFLKLLSNESNFSYYRLSTLDSSTWMRLDAAAVRALNVLPSANEVNRTESIFGVLNLCRTPQGQRLLRQAVKQPLIDLNKIEERLNVVETLVTDSELRMSLRDELLRKMPDFQRIKKRFITKSATLPEYYRLYCCFETVPVLLEALEGTSGEHVATITAVFSQPLQVVYRNMDKLISMIRFCLDLERAAKGEFVIKRGVDEGLDEHIDELQRLEAAMKKDWDKVSQDLRLENVKLESNDQLGYFYRLTKKDEKVLRNNTRYKMIDANKTGIRFHSGELKKLNVEYVAARKLYSEAEQSVMKELAVVSATYLDAMQTMNDLVAELDMLAAFAAAAIQAPVQYVRPKMLPPEAGIIKLVDVRHPCLEVQQDVTFVPNSAEFHRGTAMFSFL